jgi:hypothetical protein
LPVVGTEPAIGPVVAVPPVREPAAPTSRPVGVAVGDVLSVADNAPVSPDPVAVGPVLIPDELPVAELVATPPVVELVEPHSPPMMPEPVRLPARPVPALQHRVLIVVADVPLPGELLFLQNVLKAVQLDADTVDLLNLPGWAGKDFGPVLAGRQIDQFLLFGLDFAALGLDIELDAYHPVRFDGITYLRADAPGLIEGDRALKKQLWESLKRIFLRAHPQ